MSRNRKQTLAITEVADQDFEPNVGSFLQQVGINLLDSDCTVAVQVKEPDQPDDAFTTVATWTSTAGSPQGSDHIRLEGDFVVRASCTAFATAATGSVLANVTLTDLSGAPR